MAWPNWALCSRNLALGCTTVPGAGPASPHRARPRTNGAVAVMGEVEAMGGRGLAVRRVGRWAL